MVNIIIKQGVITIPIIQLLNELKDIWILYLNYSINLQKQCL